MAIKLPSFLSGANAKTRLFYVFAAIAAISFFIFFIVHYLGGSDAGPGSSRLAATPSLQSVPGAADVSPEFNRAISQANQQASQQAQISGGSAVPVLMNLPGQGTGFQQNCSVLCPSDDKANVADDINALVKQGKLAQEDATRLLELAKANVTVDEYANTLNDLVRQGKLSPEQARDLLEKYKKQNKNVQLAETSTLMDGMIKSGQLPLGVANQLIALQKSGLSTGNYANELNRLVREGKISPETAARLLAQYTQQNAREQAKQGAYSLQQMAAAGEITPDVAKILTDLQGRDVTVDQYADQLNKLVAAGKMTPAAAAKLLEQYKKQKAGLGTIGTLNSLVKQEEDKAQGAINDLVKKGKLSPEDAAAISAMEKNATSEADCQKGIVQYVQSKKLSAEDAKTLIENCKRVAEVRAQAQKLAKMQGNNVSAGEYEEELKRAVKAGLISPETSAALLEQYRAAVAAPVTSASTIASNSPGSAQLAQLQQQVSQSTVTSAVPLASPQPPSPAVVAEVQQQESEAELAQLRQQRLDQMQAAMSAQAQTLIAAWQVPVMVHKEGTADTDKTKAGDGSEVTTTTKTTTATGKAGSDLRPAIVKAGTILFAILETAVDSDYPDTPVMATIISEGPLKNAKLLGKLSLIADKDRVSLNFTLIDKEGWPTTKAVSAFAIDPDTARTVLASSVDYHYLKRYGAIMATSFLTGYSSAITQAGTSTTGIFGTSNTHPQLSAGSKFAVGLGQIGTTMGAAVAPNINTPNTVKVNSGVGLGILFMNELKE